jgi:carbamoyl-phosphate synthase large subunit
MDVDAIGDGEEVLIGGIMQHIEEAGIHSGDSACVIPPYHPEVQSRLPVVREYTRKLARALKVRGLMNVQFAIKDGTVYVLEVNPRASRTVPFVSKATGIPLAKVAARVMAGRSLREQGFTVEKGLDEPRVDGFFVKESVFPFIRFPGTDPVLGPEMKSTGEVMGVSTTFGGAFAKAQIAAGSPLPVEGTAFLSVNDNDKKNLVPIGRGLAELGFRLIASGGTAEALRQAGVDVETVFKVNEGRPNVVDRMVSGDVQLIINTPLGRESYFDEPALRLTALVRGIPLITTLSGAAAAVAGIRSLKNDALDVRSLQEIHGAG